MLACPVDLLRSLCKADVSVRWCESAENKTVVLAQKLLDILRHNVPCSHFLSKSVAGLYFFGIDLNFHTLRSFLFTF